MRAFVIVCLIAMVCFVVIACGSLDGTGKYYKVSKERVCVTTLDENGNSNNGTTCYDRVKYTEE